MVQFGQYLQSFRYSDWSEHYLDYEGLKRIIYSQNPQLNDLSSGDQVEVKKNELKLKVKKSKRTLLRGSDEIIRESTEFQEQRRRLSHLSESAKHNKNYQEFLKKLDENLLKINSFYETKKAFLNERLQSVENSLNTKIIKKSQVKRSLEEIFIELVLLKDFASLNYTGFTKLLKKHDKILWDIVPPLRAHYIKDKCNQQPVFGILDEVFSLQLETQVKTVNLLTDFIFL